jgi:hypothetical protein
MVTRQAMRNKHTCQICGQPFSRYWNMERHMMRKHDSRHQVLSKWLMNHQIRYKAQKTDYNSPYLNQQNSSAGSDLPIQTELPFDQENPSWLKRLRRLAEIRSLMRELTPTLASQPSNNPFLRFVDKIEPVSAAT